MQAIVAGTDYDGIESGRARWDQQADEHPRRVLSWLLPNSQPHNASKKPQL
jgi:hypothetical protein